MQFLSDAVFSPTWLNFVVLILTDPVCWHLFLLLYLVYPQQEGLSQSRPSCTYDTSTGRADLLCLSGAKSTESPSPVTDCCLGVFKWPCSDCGAWGTALEIVTPHFVDGSLVKELLNPGMNSCLQPSPDFACCSGAGADMLALQPAC